MSQLPVVLHAIRSILGSPPLPEELGVGFELRQISSLRSATLRILEETALSDHERADILLLVIHTAAEAAALPEWALDAVWSEIDWAFNREPRPVVNVYAHAARSLRRLGHQKCPVCRLDVLDEVELHRMEESEKLWMAEEVHHASKVRKRGS